MPWVSGRNGDIDWKKSGIISIGYKPVAPGIWMNANAKAMPRPMCPSAETRA